MAAPVFQYGALGAVVVFVVLFMRYQASESESEQTQRVRRDEFIEGLVKRAFEAQDTHLASWREMTTETIRVYQEVGAAYKEMNTALEANCEAIVNGTKQNHSEHLQIDIQVVNLCRTLEKLDKTIAEGHGEIKGVLSEQRY